MSITRLEFLQRMADKGINHDFILEILKGVGAVQEELQADHSTYTDSNITMDREGILIQRQVYNSRYNDYKDSEEDRITWQELADDFCRDLDIDIP